MSQFSSGSTSKKARILKLGIQLKNENVYRGFENLAHCSATISFNVYFFCHFMVNLCQSFLKNCASYSLQTWHRYGD